MQQGRGDHDPQTHFPPNMQNYVGRERQILPLWRMRGVQGNDAKKGGKQENHGDWVGGRRKSKTHISPFVEGGGGGNPDPLRGCSCQNFLEGEVAVTCCWCL